MRRDFPKFHCKICFFTLGNLFKSQHMVEQLLVASRKISYKSTGVTTGRMIWFLSKLEKELAKSEIIQM